MIPELTTDRLRMRAWRQADLDGFADFYADETTARFVGGRSGRNEVWRRMASYLGHWMLRGYGLWALEDRSSGAFAGYCGLWFPEGWPEREIGWGLARPFQGRGLAAEAARRVRAYAYDELGWETAVSCIAEDNVPSRRLAERLGARAERKVEIIGLAAVLYRHPAPTELS